MSRDLGALAMLACSCPSSTVLLHTGPNESLGDETCRCSGAGVTEAMQGLKYLTAHCCGNVGSMQRRSCVTVNLHVRSRHVYMLQLEGRVIGQQVCGAQGRSLEGEQA